MQGAACARAVLLHRAQGMGRNVDAGVRGLIYSGIPESAGRSRQSPGCRWRQRRRFQKSTSLESARSARAPKTNGPLGSPSSRRRLGKPLMMDFVWLLSGVVMRGLRATSSCSSSSETELASLKNDGSLFFRSFWVIMCFCAVTAKFVARRPL